MGRPFRPDGKTGISPTFQLPSQGSHLLIYSWLFGQRLPGTRRLRAGPRGLQVAPGAEGQNVAGHPQHHDRTPGAPRQRLQAQKHRQRDGGRLVEVPRERGVAGLGSICAKKRGGGGSRNRPSRLAPEKKNKKPSCFSWLAARH